MLSTLKNNSNNISNLFTWIASTVVRHINCHSPSLTALWNFLKNYGMFIYHPNKNMRKDFNVLYCIYFSVWSEIGQHTDSKPLGNQHTALCLAIQQAQWSTANSEKIISSDALYHLVTWPTVDIFPLSSDTPTDLPCSFHTWRITCIACLGSVLTVLPKAVMSSSVERLFLAAVL